MSQLTRYTYNVKLKNGKEIPVLLGHIGTTHNNTYDLALKDIGDDVSRLLKERGISRSEVKSLELKLDHLNDEDIIFYDLLDKTATVFEDPSNGLRLEGKNWNYAICDTPIQKGAGVFFGINWGGNDINAQSTHPPKYKERDWSFINHCRTYIDWHFGEEIENLNYTNACFFRSPDVNSLPDNAIDLSRPLFEEYIRKITPPWILMIGKPHRLGDDWKQRKRIEVFDETTNRRAFGYTGTLFGYPFGSVPYYTQAMSNEVRNEIWTLVKNYLISTK